MLPIRKVFVKNGKPIIVDGKIDEILQTHDEHVWLTIVDGPFPYSDCQTLYIQFPHEGRFGLYVVENFTPLGLTQ